MLKPSPIRVLSVDDSPFFRKVIVDLLGHRDDIDMVGCVSDPYEARDMLMASPVDVLTLDLELPRMSGLTFLKLIMERRPMPVIVLSSSTPTGSPQAAEALEAGASAVIEKPGSIFSTQSFGEKLVRDIKTAAAAPSNRNRTGMPGTVLTTRHLKISLFNPRQIVALGASTGGTNALEQILMPLPANLPGIVVVQHIPAGFSTSFATRLNRSCAMEVREAKHGDKVLTGLALIAPGNQHMEVQWAGDHYRVILHSGPLVEHQRPSVDVLFKSVAATAGAHAVAALLTGMGRDGALGMKELHDHHAHTIAQDASSSIVYGMARKAVELNAVDSILPLNQVADAIVKALQNNKHRVLSQTYA